MSQASPLRLQPRSSSPSLGGSGLGSSPRQRSVDAISINFDTGVGAETVERLLKQTTEQISQLSSEQKRWDLQRLIAHHDQTKTEWTTRFYAGQLGMTLNQAIASFTPKPGQSPAVAAGAQPSDFEVRWAKLYPYLIKANQRGVENLSHEEVVRLKKQARTVQVAELTYDNTYDRLSLWTPIATECTRRLAAFKASGPQSAPWASTTQTALNAAQTADHSTKTGIKKFSTSRVAETLRLRMKKF